jgi:hypothetical protein
MPLYSRKKIAALLARADAAATNALKGKLFEDLVVYLFEKVPGIRHSARNKKNAYQTEEIDVAFYNEQDPRAFKALSFLFLVECKNWSNPVGSMEVSWFVSKLRSRGLDFGVLVAANGITGKAADEADAHSIIGKALAERIRVIVITRDEIEGLSKSEKLVEMVKQKLCELIASGTAWS